MLNRLGNFNRIIGDGQNAIECFRKALSLESRNSDVLINLARLLFKLRFYEDAIYLSKKSIEFIRTDRSPWFQHYTLGEIYHSIGHDNHALFHVRTALKLKPNNSNALKLATELASKSYIESSRFSYVFRLFEKVFTLVTSSAPSFYLQLFFHIFILVFLVLFGFIYSLISLIYEFRTTPVVKNISTNFDFDQTKSPNQIINNQIRMNKRISRLGLRLKRPTGQGCRF